MNRYEERASTMSKAAIEKLLIDAKDGFTSINPEYQAALDRRLAQLTPKKNAEYPQQADMFRLIRQRDALNEQIKKHIANAKAGGYSYKTEVGGRTHNTGRASAGGNGPGGMRNSGHTKEQVMVITVDGNEFRRWVDVARHYNISPERLSDKGKCNQTDWKKYIFRAGKEGTVHFLDTENGREMKKAYEENGWLNGSKFTII